MKNYLALNMLLVAFILFSCTKKKDGEWDDNIKLSVKTAEFNASGDSITIKTGGDWWWITDISVDDKFYYGFSGVNLESDSYAIKQDAFIVERRNKNSLFIKVDANPLNINRIITVGLEAGDYFDRVSITQKHR